MTVKIGAISDFEFLASDSEDGISFTYSETV